MVESRTSASSVSPSSFTAFTARCSVSESSRTAASPSHLGLASMAENNPSDRASTLGESVLAGRRHLAENDLPDWDVYQLYGDPLFRYWPEPLGRAR